MELENTVWMKTLLKYKIRMIFGAKENAVQTLGYLKYYGLDCSCFVVSERADNPSEIENIPVRTFQEISTEQKEEGLAIISQHYDKTAKMQCILQENGFKNIIPSACQFTAVWNSSREILWGGKTVADVKELPLSEQRKELACIYVVTSHLNVRGGGNIPLNEKYMKYIQAGAALTGDDLCELKDNTGVHISGQNPYYCELTAGYWIANNDIGHDYVGLCHYSRILELDDRDISNICRNDVDVVFPFPYKSRYEMIVNASPELIAVLKNSDYKAAVNLFYGSHLLVPGNILFCRREIFKSYYDWMFEVLDEIKHKVTVDGTGITKRMFGYIAEHLTNIYFLKHSGGLKICFAPLLTCF